MKSNLVMALVLALAGFAAPATVGATDSAPSGHLHLTGDAAAAFVPPRDVSVVSAWTDASHGLEYTRYQQFARPFSVHVDGAQLTVLKRGNRQVLVIGSYFPGLRVVAGPVVKATAAEVVAVAAAGGVSGLTQHTELRLDPHRGRLFYRVESGAPGLALFHEVDAQTGAVIDSWDAIQDGAGDGTGIKGDTKHLEVGPVAGFGDLTSYRASDNSYRMLSEDGRFKTYTANGTKNVGGLVSDSDDSWDAADQRAAVDAQYYAALTAAFYSDRLGYDLFAECGVPTDAEPKPVFEAGIRSVVHYGQSYDNAFWHPISRYMFFGDGNSQYRPMSGAQDIVSHELTHAVTQCRGDLKYKNEPGALNEAFSDIMAMSVEWDYEEPNNSNCRLAAGQTHCADWLVGEDVAVQPGAPPFRDFADPLAYGQPSHYDDLMFIGSSYDNGGVHYNSGVANHAFYLLANGGRNALCSGPSDAHADCDVLVPPLSWAHAEQIFFAGFGLLPHTASFCDARETTLAAADTLFPGSAADHVSVDLAWAAVGRGAADCPPQPNDFRISVPNPVVAAAPGGSGELTVSLTRGTQNGQIDFAVEYGDPVTEASFDPGLSVTPEDSTVLTVDVQADAPDGVYPLLIMATHGSVTRYASAALVIDTADPEVDIGPAGFVPFTTVGLDGVVKVRITWSATDDASGVSTAELQHSSDGGSPWSAIPDAGPPNGQTDHLTTAGAHSYRLVGTDAVGNSAMSGILATSLLVGQEDAATYKKKWRKAGAGTTWGTTRFTKRRGASATFTFTGTDVVWIAQRGPRRGNAYVFIDGVRSSVSLYATSLQVRRVVFLATNLGPGEHTLKIVCRGTNNRPRVDVDGFFVLDQ